jgi:hypothetical protein
LYTEIRKQLERVGHLEILPLIYRLFISRM